MNLPEIFNKFKASVDKSERETIVKRLLKKRHIDEHEASVLLSVFDINIRADKLEMSSGAKIVAGSDFEQNYR